jgi:hypothetical protein
MFNCLKRMQNVKPKEVDCWKVDGLVEETNVIQFPKLNTDTDDNGGDNWLENLPCGTQFLTKGIGVRSYLNRFLIIWKGDKATGLLEEDKDFDSITYVDTLEFSKRNILFEVIQYGETNEHFRALQSG